MDQVQENVEQINVPVEVALRLIEEQGHGAQPTPEPQITEDMENGGEGQPEDPQNAEVVMENGDEESPEGPQDADVDVQGGVAVPAPAEIQPVGGVGLGLGRVRRAPRIRNFQRRPVYSQAQKEHAVRLLNAGVSCRQVARTLGPRCSSGTPVRWRLQMKQAEAGRDLLLNQIRRARLDNQGQGNVAPVAVPNRQEDVEE